MNPSCSIFTSAPSFLHSSPSANYTDDELWLQDLHDLLNSPSQSSLGSDDGLNYRPRTFESSSLFSLEPSTPVQGNTKVAMSTIVTSPGYSTSFSAPATRLMAGHPASAYAHLDRSLDDADNGRMARYTYSDAYLSHTTAPDSCNAFVHPHTSSGLGSWSQHGYNSLAFDGDGRSMITVDGRAHMADGSVTIPPGVLSVSHFYRSRLYLVSLTLLHSLC
jgi:hypothetical protein